MKKIVLALIALVSLGCQHIVSMSESEFKVHNGDYIEAYASEVGYLYLNTPDISVQKNLAKKCLGGTVTGIETKLLVRDFIIAQNYELFARASCQEGPLGNTPPSALKSK